MAPSQCLGHKKSRYEACNIVEEETVLEDFANCAMSRPGARVGKAHVECGAELGQKEQRASCCARKNFNRLVEGVTFRGLGESLIARFFPQLKRIKDFGCR